MLVKDISGKAVTLSVGAKTNEIIFYNKSAESFSEVDNILRIEYKVDSPYWREKYFGVKSPKFGYLLDHLDLLPKIWYNQYVSLEKDYKPKIDSVVSYSELGNFGLHMLGYDTCKSILRESYQSGKLSKSQYSYSKKKICELQKHGKEFASSGLIHELDSLVDAFMMGYNK